MKLKQWIVIGTEISRGTLSIKGVIEHAAHGGPIDVTAMNAVPDYATRVLIHDDQHPVRIEQDRFAAEEVDTPQAILGLAEAGEPRGPRPARRRSIVFDKNASHDILVNLDTERPRDDQRNPWAAEPRIARFELDNGSYEFVAWPFRPGFLT
jgi:hypothetical protein